MRVRGLKQVSLYSFRLRLRVAPHAGAWIETVCICSKSRKPNVAPHAGAWIETPEE